MTLELIPMLLLSLLLMAADGADSGSARLLLSGDHRLATTREAVIIGDATVTIGEDARLDGPVYVIGGTTRIDGAVNARVTQVSGTVTVGAGASIDELRHISGRRAVSDAADVTRRTSVVTAADPSPARTAIPLALLTVALSLLGARLVHTRRRNVDTVVTALAHHPVVTVTVGTLLMLTAVSLFVFMAFTLVLLPVSLLGVATGLAVTALGIVAWGRRVGRRLPLQRPGVATAAGVTAVVVGLTLAGTIPLVGDILVGFVLLSGVGAVVITYLGFSAFRPAPLPD